MKIKFKSLNETPIPKLLPTKTVVKSGEEAGAALKKAAGAEKAELASTARTAARAASDVIISVPKNELELFIKLLNKEQDIPEDAKRALFNKVAEAFEQQNPGKNATLDDIIAFVNQKAELVGIKGFRTAPEAAAQNTKSQSSSEKTVQGVEPQPSGEKTVRALNPKALETNMEEVVQAVSAVTGNEMPPEAKKGLLDFLKKSFNDLIEKTSTARKALAKKFTRELPAQIKDAEIALQKIKANKI
jgi:hypothetical protein